jgi:hypothetical protein
MSPGSPLSSMPVASYQAAKGFYAEGRYNYEALNTFSFYMGRTFAKESVISYSVSPMAGAVMGDFNGGSVGANIGLSYKNFYIYSQPQYSFSLENAINNFIYSWTDITYSPTSWLSAGISLQHTKPYQDKGYMQNGFVVELAVRKFTFPMYIFNPLNKSRSFVVGASFDLNFKKKKTGEPKKEDFLNESFPVRILANSPEDKNFLSEKEPVKIPVKPAAESVIKIRRVNVVVRTKEPDEDSEVKEPASLNPKSNSVAAPVSVPAVKGKRATDTLKSNTAPLKKTSQKVPEQEDDTPAAERIQAFTSAHTATFYALELGPFKTEGEAKRTQTSLTSIFTRDVILLSDMGLYKLRVTGFTDPEDAEIFKKNAVNEGLKAASSIKPYSLKGISPLFFRNVEESFKATKL